MARPHIAAETVQRHRGNLVVDSYGNEIVDWTDPQILTFTGSVQPTDSAEDRSNREGVVARWQGFLWPGDADVKYTDRIVMGDGRVYEVTSGVHVWRINGLADHIEVELTFWEG